MGSHQYRLSPTSALYFKWLILLLFRPIGLFWSIFSHLAPKIRQLGAFLSDEKLGYFEGARRG